MSAAGPEPGRGKGESAAGGSWFSGRAAGLLDGPGPLTFAVVCALLALAYFAAFVFHPERMLFGTDMLGQAFQMRHFAVQEVRAGRGIPLWNPLVYAGVPYLGILPGPVFYPTSVLYLVMPLFRAIGWTFVIHVALAGILAYAAGRSLGLGRWASAFSGLAFMFGGWFMATLHGGQDGRMFAAALIPAAFALLERGIRTGRAAPFLGMGLVLALQIFTPHVQIMYYGALMLLLYGVLRAVLVSPDGRGVPGDDGARAASRLARLAGYTALAFVVAALVGSVQLLPTLSLMKYGVRGAGQGGYAFASSWAVPPQEVSAFFLPDLIGSLRTYWGSNPFKLHTEYLGAVTVALAAIGIVGARRDRRTWILAGVTLLGVLFALGAATPVHRIAYALVPFVKKFRAPSLMLPPIEFFAALLAGIGCQRILDAREAAAGEESGAEKGEAGRKGGQAGAEPLPWLWIWVASAPFLLLALAGFLSPHGLLRWVESSWYPASHQPSPPAAIVPALRTTGFIVFVLWAGTLALGQAVARRRVPRWSLAFLALLLVADLWRVDARYRSTVDASPYLNAPSLVKRMERELRPGERVWPAGNSFGPNQLMLWGIPAITGSQNFRLSWYERLVGGTLQFKNLFRDPVLWSLLDLRFLTVPAPVGTPLLAQDTVEDGVHLYGVTPALERPHAFFPDSVRAVGDTAAALRATLALRNPSEAAVVETRGPPPQAGQGSARLVEEHPDELDLDVDASRGGLLFVSEVYHPDWHAYVDGREVPVLRTDVAFRGVSVPAGRHRLRFVYRSPAFQVGRWLSGITLVLVLGAVGWLVGRRRRIERA